MPGYRVRIKPSIVMRSNDAHGELPPDNGKINSRRRIGGTHE